MIPFVALDPKVTPESLGLIPMFLSLDDPAPAREQFDGNYAHGGGWQPMSGWHLDEDFTLSYRDEPADPPLSPLAIAEFRDETILVYPYAWVVILQQDGSFEISRMD